LPADSPGEATGIVGSVERSPARHRQATATRAARGARLDRIREIVARGDVENQQQLADLLAARGYPVTQTTISRDIATLGLVKAFRGDRHVYVSPDAVPPRRSEDAMLRRVLRDVPVEVRRSGLILILVSTPGTASILAEAIDRSGLDGPEGTIAGDNTVLVLFADERGLERWRDQLERIRELATQ
jgi:transcriptional regulator of arginine metabolism